MILQPNQVYFVAHRGTGLISRIIAWFRPPYSHIELWFPGRSYNALTGHQVSTSNGTVISADPEGVVARSLPPVYRTGTGTVVDFFTYAEKLTPGTEDRAWQEACRLIGHEYDYWMLFFGFTAKWGECARSRARMICSGVCIRVAQAIGHDVVTRVNPDSAAPHQIAQSPVLQWTGSGIIA